jgi:hypothetical protein
MVSMKEDEGAGKDGGVDPGKQKKKRYTTPVISVISYGAFSAAKDLSGQEFMDRDMAGIPPPTPGYC